MHSVVGFEEQRKIAVVEERSILLLLVAGVAVVAYVVEPCFGVVLEPWWQRLDRTMTAWHQSAVPAEQEQAEEGLELLRVQAPEVLAV
jgi:hypothetical protein